MTNFEGLLRALRDAQVDFVLIGGLAVIAHGHIRATLDLDVCYARPAMNLRRLASALEPFKPRLRGAPPELPFFWDEQTLRNGLNFTLTTSLGDIDLLGTVTGLGGYEDIEPASESIELYGHPVKLISLSDLIRTKAATGRAKDLVDLEALRALEREVER
jgi:predicted nucleotidyltransferase